MTSFMRLLLLLLVAATPFLASAQVINGNTINAQARGEFLEFGIDSDSGDEEIRYVIRTRGTINGSGTATTDLIDTSPGADNGVCIKYDADVPSNPPLGWGHNGTYYLAIGTTNLGFDLQYMAWENDGGGDCTYDAGDDDRAGASKRWGFDLSAAGTPNRWKGSTLGNSINGSRVGFSYVYRLAAGDGRSDPLQFGQLVSNTIYRHRNTNFASPESADSRMGYSDDFRGGSYNSSPDVLYSFVLSEPSSVDITLNYSHTTLDERIHLLNNNNSIITSQTAISGQLLCAGTYKIVVEGRTSSSEGNFEIGIRGIRAQARSIDAGVITAPSARVCAGTRVRAITSTTGASSALQGNPVYHWEKKVGGGPWQNIGNSNSTSFHPSDDQPDGEISFRRIANFCGLEAASNTITFRPASEAVTVGRIELDGLADIPPGADPGNLVSATNADASTGPASIFWQQKGATDLNWQTIAGSGGQQAYNPGVLSVSTDYRRGVYGGCGTAGEAEFSNVVRVTVIQPNGKISGNITSGQGLFTAGVAGVTVCATLTEAIGGAPAGTQRCTSTPSDNEGFYEITGIYYGSNEATYEIVPSLDGREFFPVLRNATLSAINNTAIANFRDESTFTVSGTVQLAFAGESCPVPGVAVELKRSGLVRSATVTNEDGNYAFDVDAAGVYTVEVNVPDRVFTPASREVNVDRNRGDVNFTEATTHELTGKVLAGCDVYFGRAVLTITEAENCFSTTTETDDEGNYSITLPAKAYFVALTGTLDLEEGFDPLEIRNRVGSSTFSANLTETDQSLDITYHRKPVVEILGLPEAPCADYDFAVLGQGQQYPITINVYEGEIGGCPVDTALIYLTDAISGDNAQPDTLRLGGGSIEYVIIPGAPNIVSPYLKTLSLGVIDSLEESVDQTITALTTGSRPREQNFVTTTPELPLMILRDPPGDASSSYLEQSEETEIATSFSALIGGSVNVWGEAKVGTKFSTGLGYSTEVEVWGSIKNSVEVAASASTLTENILTLTATERFSTSDNPLVNGTTGDVFMGAAMNLVYAITDEVVFNPGNCEPVLTKSWMVGNEGFATTYLYTESYIRNNTIPTLLRLSEQTSNPDSVSYYVDQAKVWQQILVYNEELKSNAIPYPGLENLSFSSGAERTNETVTASSNSTAIEFNGEVSREVATELGLEVAGAGFTGGVIAKLRLELGSSTTNRTLQTLTTGFTLKDNSEVTDSTSGDGFNVAVKVDPVYNTPVFEVLSGSSSCPHEPNTAAREAVSLTADALVIADVPVDGAAVFNLTASNISETDEARSYKFRFHPASNPNGADVKINGTLFSSPLDTDLLDEGSSNTFQVTVKRGVTNVSVYEGLEFEMYSDCDDNISKKVYLTAIFQNDCSEITLSEPGDNFITNTSAEDQLSFVVKDYDLAKLEEISLEVTPTGQSSWAALGGPVPGTDLSTSSAGSLLMRNIENFDDGRYDFRVKLGCGTSTVFSNRISGLFDRRYPRVLGTPQPVDDNYITGDQISLTFDEVISCEDVTAGLVDVFTGTSIAVEISCFNNTLFVTPAIDLSTLEGQPLEITIDRVQDVNGNEIPSPVSWTFTGGTSAVPNDSDGDGFIDAIDRCPGADDNQDEDADGIPDACDFCKDLPSVGLDFDGEDDILRQESVEGLDSTLTIEAWMYAKALPNVRSWLLTLGQRNTGGHHWLLQPNGKLHLGVYNTAGLLPSIRLNEWTHIATVYSQDTLTVYVNGFKFGEVPVRYNLTNTTLLLGPKINNEDFFNGRIDELRIWNTARTQAEISAGMREELAGSEAGLMAYYNFNEGVPGGDNSALTTVTDLSTNGADAELLNFTANGDASNWTIGANINALDADDSGFGDVCEPFPVAVDQARIARDFGLKNLYPNPARDVVTVEISSRRNQLITLEMVDLMGRVLSSRSLTALEGLKETTINIQQLQPGLYLVRLRSKAGTSLVRKLVVE